MDALQYQLENERPVKSEALVYASPPQSAVDDLQAEIDQLKENLSESNTDRSFLRTRVAEVERQSKQTLIEKYTAQSVQLFLFTYLPLLAKKSSTNCSTE